MTKALAIIVDAFERLNRLSPGEALNADDAALGFRKLNLLVDELAADPCFLFRNVTDEAAQSGDIALGSGAWAAVPAGAEVLAAWADNVMLAPMTGTQYNALFRPITAGQPTRYMSDGLGFVRFDHLPTGQAIRLQTRAGVAEFADQETEYTLPLGYRSFLGAALAVRLAPNVLGSGATEDLLRMERMAKLHVAVSKPAILDIGCLYQGGGRSFNIMTGR